MAVKKEWKDMTRKEKMTGIVVLAVITFVLIGALGGGANKNAAQSATPTSTSTDKATAAPAEPAKTQEPAIPAEYKSALNKATSYSETMHMSKVGVYDQLTSQYGEKFTTEAARYAIDHVKADWNANALAKAKSYQDTMSMSPSAIHDQLTSSNGEKFTADEADYAIAHLDS